MEFALAVTFGSSLQVALFVAPVLVLLGLVVGQPMNLVFTPLEIAAVAAAVGISSLIAIDGETELARGRAADARLRDPRHLVLRVRRSALDRRRRRRGGGRAAARRRSEDQAAATASVVGSSSSISSSSSDVPGSNAASAIGSVAAASPSATAWSASESAACCAS